MLSMIFMHYAKDVMDECQAEHVFFILEQQY